MICDIINNIKASLPEGTRLVAVSKYQPLWKLQEAYQGGQRIFGESHVQEMQEKHLALPPDVEWHFIGHLQRNKVKYIAPYVSLIHAVDSPQLLTEISRQGQKVGRRIPCLLQLHVAQEETKYGFTIEECRQYLQAGEWRELSGASIQGIMCMASNTPDAHQIATEFESAHDFLLEAKENFFAHDPQFGTCSMGMSGDYPIAIAHGSTLIRIGSMIFGER